MTHTYPASGRVYGLQLTSYDPHDRPSSACTRPVGRSFATLCDFFAQWSRPASPPASSSVLQHPMKRHLTPTQWRLEGPYRNSSIETLIWTPTSFEASPSPPLRAGSTKGDWVRVRLVFRRHLPFFEGGSPAQNDA